MYTTATALCPKKKQAAINEWGIKIVTQVIKAVEKDDNPIDVAGEYDEKDMNDHSDVVNFLYF